MKNTKLKWMAAGALFALLLMTGLVDAQTPIQVTASPTRHGPERGALVIIGGGAVGDELWDKIVELGGGKDNARFVIVTNAGGDGENLRSSASAPLKQRIGEDNVVLFDLKTIEDANNEANLKVLRQATGVFFDGGRQWRIADAYLNTQVHREFLNLLDRGGVISGSSAGASIQGSFLWRGDTKGADILIGDHTQGLGFLRNSVIDQHVLARNRQFDLIDFVKASPQLIGLGPDESTAAVVIKDELEVLGKSYVAIYDNSDPNKPFTFYRQHQKYDLKEHKPIRSQVAP
jgi:cyanophycinase